jgi:flagellar hook-associated protein 2
MATGINFSGAGSGIDFSSIADAIVLQRQVPIAQLQTRRDNINTRVTALRQLNSLLATLTEASNVLTNRDLGTGRTSTSSNTSVLTTSNTANALPANYAIKVDRLASAFSEATTSFASSSSAILAGGETSVAFTLRTGGDPTRDITLNIDSSNNSLEGLRQAINNSGAGVTASIINVSGDGTQNRLVLSSKLTGVGGRVELVDDANSQSFQNLGLASTNPPGAVNDFSALDAKFEINGLTLYRSANTVADAITGLTLNLKETGTSSVTVGANTDELTQKIRSFVDAYNAVQDFVAAQYRPDVNGKPGGSLVGDPTLRGVQSQLRAAVGAGSTTNGGAFNNLTQIGIGRDDAGKLKLDTAVLGDKVKNSFADVKALFSGASAGLTGLANSTYTSFQRLSDNISGTVQTAIQGYTSSITNLEKSISAQQERMAAERASLMRRFSAIDSAISQMNSINTNLSSVIKAMQPKDS